MTAVYLYCVVKSAKRPSTARAPRGLPGASAPAAIDLGRSLWLIVADVPLDTYGPGQLDAALGDLPWVADIAVAHEAVVERFARSAGATVVPMKLFTMFSSLDRAVRDIAARRDEMTAIVMRIAGCEEWGVRVTRAAGKTRRRPAAATARSGAAFLAAKKRARDDAREAARTAADAAAGAYTALAAVSRDARRRDDVPARATTPPLLDAAFLVSTGRRTRFKSAARRAAAGCAEAGAQMMLSGPWPAYHFIQAPQERT
jgi:hypothetical protein